MLRSEWKQNCHFGVEKRLYFEPALVKNLLRPTSAEATLEGGQYDHALLIAEK